jgi:hypothetical protein
MSKNVLATLLVIAAVLTAMLQDMFAEDCPKQICTNLIVQWLYNPGGGANCFMYKDTVGAPYAQAITNVYAIRNDGSDYRAPGPSVNRWNCRDCGEICNAGTGTPREGTGGPVIDGQVPSSTSMKVCYGPT